MKVHAFPVVYNESKEIIVAILNKEPLKIIEGKVYEYIKESPKGCKGCLYRVLKFILDVPSYQQKVLVEALTGPDRGLWFTCTPANFSLRYAPSKEAEEREKSLPAKELAMI